MCLNTDIRTHKDASSFYYLAPTYDLAVIECAHIGRYSCVWTILALSNVINTNMDVLYPCVNGTKDLAFLKLNMELRPNDPVCERPIKIMWSNTSPPMENKTWTPNHFVPIVPKSAAAETSKNLAFNFGFNNWGNSTPKQVSGKIPKDLHLSFDGRDKSTPKPKITSPVSVPSSPLPSPNSTPPSSPEIMTPMPAKKRPRTTSQSPTTKKKSKPNNISSPMSSPMSSSSPDNSFLSRNSFSVLEHEECDIQPEEPATLQPLTNNKFMTIDEAYKAITTPSLTISSAIPIGPKNNVYLLLQRTSDNVHEYPDDCGAWGRTGTTVNSTFIKQNGKLKSVFLKNALYCVEKMIQGQRQYPPIEPQPTEDDIIKSHRYYAKSKVNETYRKRVTIFTKLPKEHAEKQTTALVEYQGELNIERKPHGNNKTTNEPYMRTDPGILREAAKITKQNQQMPIKTCHQMMLDDSMNAPNAKQIRDKVYWESKKEDNPKLHNVADEVLAAISMCQNGESNIREILVTPKKPPSIVIYSDEQLEDLKTNCSGSSGSVLGIDRTFNLGPCFVTTTTYKNRKIIKRETLQNPIFLGPTLLHWDGETDSYYKFFCHLNSKLGFPSGLKIGSDEEKAIMKAVRHAFVDPVQLLCTKHLKDNVRRYLKDKEGCSTKDRERIVSTIFGQEGIINADDSFSYDSKTADLDSHLKQKFPQFQQHFETRLKPLLQKHVYNPLQTGIIKEQWTNNNSESMNNRLKQSLNWKPHKIPELITKINEISAIQFHDLRCALHGNGNYILEDTMKQHKVAPDVWLKLSRSEKNRRVWKLLGQKPVAPDRTNYIKSSNYSFQVKDYFKSL